MKLFFVAFVRLIDYISRNSCAPLNVQFHVAYYYHIRYKVDRKQDKMEKGIHIKFRPTTIIMLALSLEHSVVEYAQTKHATT